jgi:uncharacterized SAM-binding protein YcdF (DUF218 family)
MTNRTTTTPIRMIRRLFIAALTSAFLAGIAGISLLFWLAWQIDDAGLGDPPRQTDAIVILGALVRADGEPGRDLSARTRWAVSLFHERVALGEDPVLITTGGYTNDRLSAAAVAQRKAIEAGVPAERIFLADGGQTTGEDAQAAAAVMAAHGWRSATLVSHPLHLYRSRWHFARAGVPEIYTYAAGNRARLPGPARVYLSSREAFGVVWAAVDGWERFEPLGRFLEALVYGRRRL